MSGKIISGRRSLFARWRAMFETRVSGVGLACFRIMYTTVLICEVSELFYFRHLVFDSIPYVVESENSYTPILIAWLVTLVFLLVGLFTTTACVVNYVLTLLTFSAFHTYEYHIDYIYTAVNLLLIFSPVSERLSLDALRKRLLQPAAALQSGPPNEQVSVIHYDALILVGIALVYFDSVFYKWMSPMWISGLGVWLPASLPQVAWVDLTPLLDQKWLMLLLGYTTLLLETAFLFVMWWRKSRVVLLAVGLGLHLAIALVFPIPWFGLAVASLYLLMVPQSWYETLFRKIRRREPRLEMFYDPRDRFTQKLLVVLKHFDVRQAIRCTPLSSLDDGAGSMLTTRRSGETFHGPAALCEGLVAIEWLAPVGRILQLPPCRWILGRWLWDGSTEEAGTIDEPASSSRATSLHESDKARCDDLLDPRESSFARQRFNATACVALLILCCQLLIVLESPLAQSGAEATGTDRLRQKVVRMVADFRTPVRIVLGATSHPVFMDSHFRGYNHVIGLAYREHSGELHWLPLIEENGHFGSYNTGRYFVKWTWRVCAPTMRKESLEKGIRDFTAFWCRQNHINLINVHFTVFAKRIESPPLFTATEGASSGWEKGFYRKQREQPWQVVGNAHWTPDGQFETQIGELEKL